MQSKQQPSGLRNSDASDYHLHSTEVAFMTELASTPNPPYFAVVFTSIRSGIDDGQYVRTAQRMTELAASQPGFLGIEHARGADGLGITISYWATEESIRSWQQHSEHLQAQHDGRAKWYEKYQLRVCRVERVASFSSTDVSLSNPPST